MGFASKICILTVLAAALLALLPSATISTPPVTPTTQPATGRSPRMISYRLNWSWGRAKTSTNEKGWEVRTNRGYIVRLTAGYLVSHSAELNPLEPVAPVQSKMHWLGSLGPRAALANHSTARNP